MQVPWSPTGSEQATVPLMTPIHQFGRDWASTDFKLAWYKRTALVLEKVVGRVVWTRVVERWFKADAA